MVSARSTTLLPSVNSLVNFNDIVCSSDLVGQCVVADGKKTVHLLPSRLRVVLVLAHPHHHPGKEIRGHTAETAGRWGKEKR